VLELAASAPNTCWLCSSSWQGITGLVAIAALLIQSALTIWTTLRTTGASEGGRECQEQDNKSQDHEKIPSPAPTRNDKQLGIAARLGGAVFVWTISYLLYSVIWGALLLAFFGKNASVPGFIVTPFFVFIAAPPATGALLVRSPHAGAAICGGISLGLAFLTVIPSPETGQKPIPPIIAWFAFGAIFGALCGIVTAGIAFKLAQTLGIPLPRTPPDQNKSIR
jgi:hypothetical protein